MQYTVLGVKSCAFLEGTGARAVKKNYKEPEQETEPVKKLKTAPSSRDPELGLLRGIRSRSRDPVKKVPAPQHLLYILIFKILTKFGVTHNLFAICKF